MTKLKPTALLALAGISLLACGEDSDEKTGPTAWAGAELHLIAAGTLGGQSIDVELRGAAADDVMTLGCERDYEVPMMDGEPNWAAGRLVDFTVEGAAGLSAGIPRFEAEFKEHDFQRMTPGEKLTVVPRNEDVTPTPAQMWFEWEWVDAAGESVFEESAIQGTFTLGEFSGEPDASGLVIPEGTGRVGGFIEARWSATEEIRLSFSVKCGGNEIDMIE